MLNIRAFCANWRAAERCATFHKFMYELSNIKEDGGGVFFDSAPFPTVGRTEMEFLKGMLAGSPRGRTRLCTHKKPENHVHEMFISFVGGNYVRPAKHVGKDESLHLLEGWGEYYFFDQEGKITDIVPLGTFNSGRKFYCRIPAMSDHAVVIRSEQLAFHEATTGPFNRQDTILSPWAPVEGDAVAIKSWMDGLPSDSYRPSSLLKSRRVGADLFVVDQAVVSVGASEVENLKAEIQRTNSGEMRLELNYEASATLQESIVVRRRDNYARPRLLSDDASIHVIEGAVDVFAFSAQGALLSVVHLQSDSADAKFYTRTAAHTYRCLLPCSDVVVTHEVSAVSPPGKDEIFASWAPSTVDAGATVAFVERLRGMVSA